MCHSRASLAATPSRGSRIRGFCHAQRVTETMPASFHIGPDPLRRRVAIGISCILRLWPEYGPEFDPIRAMKRISIQDLKAGLSAAVADAESGTTIVITRHNQPVAQLGPPAQPHVRQGSSRGRRGILPALRRGTRGRYLAILIEDRSGR